MWNLTPPAVCQARTLPIVCPVELTSGIGAPPVGSTVEQATRRSGKKDAALRIGVDLHQQLALGNLRAGFGVEFGDRSVERRRQRMFHFHRLKYEQTLSFCNLCTLRHL